MERAELDQLEVLVVFHVENSEVAVGNKDFRVNPLKEILAKVEADKGFWEWDEAFDLVAAQVKEDKVVVLEELLRNFTKTNSA